MAEDRSKWKRRLVRAPVILVAVYVLGRAADYVWYRVQRPAESRDANWSGEWRTAKYFGVSGRLLVRLPDPLPENQDFRAEALVYYPVYSPWKTGKFVRMDFTGHFSPDARASAGKSTNDIPGGGKLKFKAVVGNQIVDYTAVIDEDRTVVAGGYVSRSPDDYGSFSAERE